MRPGGFRIVVYTMDNRYQLLGWYVIKLENMVENMGALAIEKKGYIPHPGYTSMGARAPPPPPAKACAQPTGNCAPRVPPIQNSE